MTEKRNIPTRVWVIALAVVFAMALTASLLMGRVGSSTHIARIYQDGTLIREIDLSAVEEPYEFTIKYDGGFNTISVRPGGICVSSADCSDGTCMKQGWLEGGLTPIVCLPHKLVIQLEEPAEVMPTEENEFDAVAG